MTADTNGYVTEKHCLDKHGTLKWALGIMSSVMLAIVLSALGYAVAAITTANSDIKDLRKDTQSVVVDQAVLKKTCETLISEMQDIKGMLREMSKRRDNGNDK